MTRQDLRNRTPKFRGVDTTEPYPKPKRARRFDLGTTIWVVVLLAVLALLWETRPSNYFPECRAASVPRYCVD